MIPVQLGLNLLLGLTVQDPLTPLIELRPVLAGQLIVEQPRNCLFPLHWVIPVQVGLNFLLGLMVQETLPRHLYLANRGRGARLLHLLFCRLCS